MNSEQIKKLKDLKTLLDSGMISQEEFNIEKTAILKNSEEEENPPTIEEKQEIVELPNNTIPPINQAEQIKASPHNSKSQEKPKKSYIWMGFKIMVGLVLGLIVLLFIARFVLRQANIKIDNHLTGEAAVIIENESQNPYEIWIDGSSKGIIEGYATKEIRTDNNTMMVRALQQSGFAFYPTENIRNFIHLEGTHTYKCRIGNMKKNKTIRECECHGR